MTCTSAVVHWYLPQWGPRTVTESWRAIIVIKDKVKHTVVDVEAIWELEVCIFGHGPQKVELLKFTGRDQVSWRRGRKGDSVYVLWRTWFDMKCGVGLLVR
jgi:hypothetical protein